MRVLVADASAIVEYVLQSERAVRVSAMLRPSDYDVHVPYVCDVEMLAAIRRALLLSRLDRQRALEALEDYRDLPITRHGHTELMPRALGLRSYFTAADAMYVALAELLDGTLLTADPSLARATVSHTRVRVEEI